MVTIHTSIMPDLKEKRAVAKSLASFDALAAARTKKFVYGVLVVGILHKVTYDGACGAELVFRAGVEGYRFRRKITRAEIAVSAHPIDLDALDGRLLEDTFRGTVSTGHTFMGVNLPTVSLRLTASPHQKTCGGTQAQKTSAPKSIFQETAPGDFLFQFIA